MTTTELAAQVADSGRMGESAYFAELATQHGRDFTGLAFMQAFLKVAQERAAR